MTDPVHRVDRLWPDPAADLALDDAMAAFTLPAPPPDRPLVGVEHGHEHRRPRTAGGHGRGPVRPRRSTADAPVPRGLRRRRQRSRHAARRRALAAGGGRPRRAARRRWTVAEPIGVVVAGHDPIPLDARWFTGDERRILIVGRDNPIEAAPEGTELVRATDARPAPRWILATLAARGIRSLLLEGGPHLNAAFLAEGLIDELYWTVGAHLLGTDALPMFAPIAGGSPYADRSVAWPARQRPAPRRRALPSLPVRIPLSGVASVRDLPDLGRVGVWGHLDSLPVAAARTYARRVEALGYGALWVPETVGREPFALLGLLAGETSRLVLGTSIVSIWGAMRSRRG